MLTEDLILVFGTSTELAQFFGITQSAVSQWENEVPELREYQIRERMPDIDARIKAAKKKARQAA